MEMKPTLHICIGNCTQNDVQVESIIMKMKRISIIFFLIHFSYPENISLKGATSKHLKISFY